MSKAALIVGGGIGGLAAALALARVDWRVNLFERVAEFGEVGAGIQLGPNVTRILRDWGLEVSLQAIAAFPDRLVVRRADNGVELGRLALGASIEQRHGAPYATIHRADLHGLLLHAVRQRADVSLHQACTVDAFEQDACSASLRLPDERRQHADLMVGADGLWSTVRPWLLGDGPPRRTGHLAYRALIAQANLPAALRSDEVSVWLGPDMHVVHYPVRGGAWLNMVVVLHEPPGSRSTAELSSWDHAADPQALRSALRSCAGPLRDRIEAVDPWRLWVLNDRPPMAAAAEHGRGRVALLGDAAHPMRPYLAQGAGMAIEDAAELARQCATHAGDAAAAVARFAEARWRLNRQVQQRAERNGRIFHASGALRLARDAAMKLLGERLLDQDWLYRA